VNALAVAKEFFLQARAEQTARAYAPAQAERVASLVRAARRRRAGTAAGWSGFSQPAAASLARESLALFVLAAEIARDADADLAAVDVAAALAGMSDGAPDGWERARDALASKDPLFFDSLEPRAFAETLAAIRATARFVESRVEARSVTAVRATRWARFAAIAVLVLYAAVAAYRATRPIQNVARGKKVTISSQHPHTKGDPGVLTDGNGARGFAFHTRDDESPWVTIDLDGFYTIQRVVVHTRGDGFHETIVPLALEFSDDGARFREVARKSETFEPGHPWIVDLSGERTRFVRLRVTHRGSLALAAVEVLGSP